MSVDFSPDGNSLVVAGFRDENPCESEVMAIYDVESGVCTRTFKLGYELYAAAFSPDGRGGRRGKDPAKSSARGLGLEAPGTPPRILAQSARVFADFSTGPTATFVAGDVNGHVQFWDLEKSVGKEADGPEFRHDKQVRVVSFSDDGGCSLSVGRTDSTGWMPSSWSDRPAPDASRAGPRRRDQPESRAGGHGGFAGDIRSGTFALAPRRLGLSPP